MIDMRHSAQRLAARGRFGDTMLLHVHPLEVAGIASLVPGGRLTINPETGLPEAFFFLPFLAAMFGAAAPAAAAATAGAAAATTALGAGAATAAGGALASTLGAGALTPALTAGTSLAAGAGSLGAAAAPALAAAAPAVASGIGGLASTLGAGALTPALTAGTSLAAPAAAAAPAAGLIGHAGISSLLGGAGADALAAPIATVAPTGVGTGTAGISSLGAQGALPPMSASVGGNLPALPATAPTYVPTSIPGATGVPVHAAPIVHAPPVLTHPSSAIVVTGAGGGAPGGTGTGAIAPVATTTTPPIVPDAGKTGLSGLSKYLDMKYLMPAYLGLQMIKGLMPGKKSKDDDEDAKKGAKATYQGGDPVFPSSGYDAGSASGEWNYFPKPIKYFADGGIVSLANGGPVDPQQQLPQDMSFPLNGGGIGSLASGPSMEDLPTSDYPTSQVGSTPEPPAGANEVPAPNETDKELIMQTVEAIQGKSADPQPVLMAFIKEFGEQAFQDLVTRIKSSGQNQQQAQQGDGQSDSIPATIDGRQPARLSQDEFVVPADVVSGLGNGSTSAGAKHLSNMVGNVRQAKTGAPSQPKPVNAGKMIPGYRKGGRVKVPKPQPDEVIGSYLISPGTEPRSSRLDSIYRDYAMPITPRMHEVYGDEWANNIGAYQDAGRFLARERSGQSAEEALRGLTYGGRLTGG